MSEFTIVNADEVDDAYAAGGALHRRSGRSPRKIESSDSEKVEDFWEASPEAKQTDSAFRR